MAKIGANESGRPAVVPVFVILLAFVVGRAPAQFNLAPPLGGPQPSGSKVYFDTSHEADARLRSAENHAKAGDFSEAIDIYQRVIQEFGDKVVEVPPEDGAVADDSRLSVNARRECQRRIASLPAEVRAMYRSRVDAQAGRWYGQGAADRDKSALRRVVSQAFCSSWGDDALDLLGDLAFQEGQFAEALAAYEQLVPDRSGGPRTLVHPDPSVDLGRVAAKKLLCRAAIGEHPPTPAELEALAAEHPEPALFVGRRGPLARLVAEAIRDDHLSPPAQADGRWPTFAGSPTRDRVAPGSVDVGSLQWRADLETIVPTRPNFGGGFRRRDGGNASLAQISPERLLGYHPIVVGDQVLVADENHVTSYNLNVRPGEATGVAGAAVASKTWQTKDLIGPTATNRIGGGLARYTLTAEGNRVFARIGPPPASVIITNRMGMGGFGGASASLVVGLDRAEGKVLWKREASEIVLPKRRAEGGSRTAVFEGTPLADRSNVYVAMTDRIEMTATYVACLDAENGSTKWVRYVCEASANVDPILGGGVEISHRLLTLDGPNLYYQTNLGAVASLDAESGGIRWLATYPWPGHNNGATHERDINPAIVHDGLVIVAPNDAPSIYAYEASSGRLAWKTPPIAEEVRLAHLLGVSKGYVIATGDRVLWFDAKTGKLAHAWPDTNQAVQGFGRGILAGDRVYWPTETEIHVLDQSSGLRADAPIKLQESYQCKGGGNLALGDGYLIVAQSNALIVFCQNSRLIERYRDEIARAPDQATNYFLLARAAEAVGQDDLALESLEGALARSRPSESMDGVPLGDASRDNQRRLLMKLGAKARAAGNWPEASRRYEAAATAARTDRDRLASRLELAEVQAARGDPKLSVATLQALLADERLRVLNVDAADGHRTVRADLLIADRLNALIRDKGGDLYAEFDRAAAALFDRGKAEGDPRLLEDVARSYPAARVVADAWSALGPLYEKLRRPGDSARAYKHLLAGSTDEAVKARAWLGLARAYESQKLWVLARDAYLQAKGRHAEVRLDDIGGARLGDFVAERLAREPFGRMVLDRAEPSVPTPLRRRWDRRWAEPTRPIAAEGSPPSSEASRVFLVQGRSLRPIDPATGESPWSRDLEGEPIWVGYLADRIIAATRTRVAALSLDLGNVDWQYDLGAAAPGPAGANPFDRPGPADDSRDSGAATLSDFRIVGNRVFCLRGDRALLAFDGDSGLLDWSYTPTSGRINPRLHVGPRRIVLQVRKPNAVLVLDTATGRRRAEFPRAEEEGWPRDPLPIDDDHVALVADRMTVALLDLNRGVNTWIFREASDQPRHGPPRLIGDAERLLVLHDGSELIRLDSRTGAKRWSRLLGSEDLSERADAIALGADRAFVANGPMLMALSLIDGRASWKCPLDGPSSGWSVALTERSVVAYPSPPPSREQSLASLPLILLRRDDGQPLQRLLFQTSVSDLTIRFTPKGALVATQAGLWALGDRQVMDGSRTPR